jgi:hypothetical protein
MATGMPGMATQNTPKPPQAAADRTIFSDGFDRVGTACRRESTIPAKQRTEPDLVDTDQSNQGIAWQM